MMLPAILAETTRSQTERELFTNWTWAPWATVVFVVLVVAGISYLYSRESSPAGKAYRAFLATLRLVAIGLVLVMLSEVMLTTTETGKPRLVILVDRSASMFLPLSDTDDAIRLQAAGKLLIDGESSLLGNLADTYELDVRLVGDGLSPIASLETEALVAELESIGQDDPTARASRLGDAVTTAIESRGTALPAAVVLLTDGRTTAGRSLDEAGQIARRRGVPIYAVGYGTTNEPIDLRLTNLLAQSVAFKDDLLAITATLEATAAQGQTARVQVRDVANDKVVASEDVNIDSATFSQNIQLVVEPDREGEITYAVEVEPLENERDSTNNQQRHLVTVRDESIRVLLAAGYPNYEYRYLKNLLDRDSTFELTSYLQEADLKYASQDETAIQQLSVKEDGLDDFDVLIVIDMNPRLLPPRWWQTVERHVVEQGGGLVLVSGPRYYPWQYTSVPAVATLSPVQVNQAGRRGGLVDPGYQLRLTPLGDDTVAMQLGSSAGESRALWQQLAPLYWYVAADAVKPAARVLAEHPTARSSDGSGVPLIAEQYVGAGRVLYHGIDSTWRWRFRAGDVYLARYWGQTLRQLARGKALDERSDLELLVDRQQYELGQPVRLRMRVDSKQTASLSGGMQVLLTAPGEPNRRVTLAPSIAMPEEWQAVVGDLPPGQYRATVTDSRLDAPPEAVEFRVTAPPGELADATMNRGGLERLCADTYGKFYGADATESLTEDLPTGGRVPLESLPPIELWNQWWLLAAISTCLTTEWILRKRQAML